MKQGIHPEYKQTHFVCSGGNEFTAGGTADEVRLELCNQCHPFYTGKQKLVDTGGRVERYKQRYARAQAAQAAQQQQQTPAKPAARRR